MPGDVTEHELFCQDFFFFFILVALSLAGSEPISAAYGRGRVHPCMSRQLIARDLFENF